MDLSPIQALSIANNIKVVNDAFIIHFVFDDASHFEAGDLCSISLQASADPSGTIYMYVSTIVEFDTSTDLGSSSANLGSNP